MKETIYFISYPEGETQELTREYSSLLGMVREMLAPHFCTMEEEVDAKGPITLIVRDRIKDCEYVHHHADNIREAIFFLQGMSDGLHFAQRPVETYTSASTTTSVDDI